LPTEQAPAPPDETPDVALSEEELKAVAPEILANNMSEYFRAWGQRIRNGESGALPVIVGLIAIVVFFQIERSVFLTDDNLVNLLVEAAIYVMIGAAEIFILLLSEIDLSLGYGAGVGAFVIAELIAAPVGLPWWVGIICGLLVMALLGFVQGSLVARLGLPSFIVTLGGQLGFLGLMQVIANADSAAVGGVIQISPASPIYNLVNTTMSPSLAWIAMVVCVAAFAAMSLLARRTRQSRGLTVAPFGVSLLSVGGAAIGGIVLVIVCNGNKPSGMPWVVPFVLLVLVLYSWLLSRTRIGRYIYAVGANPEAARRAGINVRWVITFAFIMSSVTAGLAGIIYASNQGSMSVDIDGGQLVLFAVATAVIGGTSLFGGHGKMFNALLGGIVIAVVFNGLGLMGVGAAVQDMATAVVLIAAVTLDALVRRRATAH
jgi:D-xylose transport system permease protein